MSALRLPNVTAPCKDCPLRKDSLAGWLGKERATEIIQARSFVCHKRIDLQCAGHMLLKTYDNDFYMLAKRMRLPFVLSGKELVFNSESDFIEHHCSKAS